MTPTHHLHRTLNRFADQQSIVGPARLLSIAMLLALGLIVLTLVNDSPQRVVVVDRVTSADRLSLLAVDAWHVTGSGSLGQTPTTGPAGSRELRLEKSSTAAIEASVTFAPAAHGIVRLGIRPEAAGTSLEIGLLSDGVRLIDVPVSSVARDTDTAIRTGATSRLIVGRSTEISIRWQISEASTYSLLVDGITVQEAPIQTATAIDEFTLTVFGTGTGGWRISDPAIIFGTTVTVGPLAPHEQVRLTHVDGRLVGTSTGSTGSKNHRRTIALPIDPQPFPARFELLREGRSIAEPSQIVFDVAPGDQFSLGTELSPLTSDIHTRLDFPRVAGLISILVGMMAFLAVAPSINTVPLAFGLLAYAAARVLMIEGLVGAGLPPSPLNRTVVALALGAAIAITNGKRLWQRLHSITTMLTRRPRRSTFLWLTIVIVVAVIGMMSTFAVAEIPTPEDAAQYAYVGGRWLQHGEVPFVDQYADKSPGLFLIYGLLADLAGHGLNSLLITRLLVTSLIVLIGIRLAHHLGGRVSALCAGSILALVVSWIQFGGDAPRAAEIGLLPLLAAFVLLHEGRSRQHPSADFLAGAFLGAAILTSAQTVYALPVVALWLWPDPHSTGLRKRATRLLTGGIALIAAVLLYFTAKGALEPMYVWWIERSVTHVDFWLRSHVLDAKPGLDFFLWVPAPYQLIYAAIGIMLLALIATKKWWAAAVVAIAAITQHASIKPLYRFEEHDYMALSLVLFLGTAFLAQSASWHPRVSLRAAIQVSGVAAAAVLVAWAVIPSQYQAHVSPPGNNFDRQAPTMAAQIAQVTPHNRRLFVWNNSIQIPLLLDSPVAGGWNQTHSADNNPAVREEWVAAIESELPHAIVTPRGLGEKAFRDVQSRLRYLSVESSAEAYELYLRAPADPTPMTPIELRHVSPGCRLVTQAQSEVHVLPTADGSDSSTQKVPPGSVQVIHAYVHAEDGASPMTMNFGSPPDQLLSLEFHHNGDIYQDGTYITRVHNGFSNRVQLSVELADLAGEHLYSLFVDGDLVNRGIIGSQHTPVDTVSLFAAKHSSEWSVHFAPSMAKVLRDWDIERTAPSSTALEAQTVARKQFDVPVGRVFIELDLPATSSITVSVGLDAGRQAEISLNPDGVLSVPNMPDRRLDLPDNQRARMLLSVHENGPNTVYDISVNGVPTHSNLPPLHGDTPNREVQIRFHNGPLEATPVYKLVITGRGGITVRNAAPHDIVQLEHERGIAVHAATTAMRADSTTIMIPLTQVFAHGYLTMVDTINWDATYRSHHINNLCPGDVYEFVRT